MTLQHFFKNRHEMYINYMRGYAIYHIQTLIDVKSNINMSLAVVTTLH